MKTTLRYAGGKTRGIKLITPFVKDYDKIVSPFIGGGSLEVYWSSLGKEVIGYDIFDMLVNYWDVLLKNPNELYNEMKKIEPSKDNYKVIKDILMSLDKTQEMLSDWKTDYYKRDDIITLDRVKMAAYYYFNHNTSYGPGYLGWGSSVYLKQDKWDKMCDNVKNFDSSLKVYESTFDKSIKKHSDDFLYLDPPYFLDKDKDNKMFKGIYPTRNIDIHHNGFDHELLRDLLLNHNGDFVLSYNNCETIREFYKDFDFYYPEWSYSMGNGETRIGKNRKYTQDTIKKSHEILIVKKTK